MSVTSSALTVIGHEASISITEAANAAECDIGKLLHLGIDICNLNREEKCHILKREPKPHSSASTHSSICFRSISSI